MAFPGMNANSMLNLAAPLLGGASGASGLGGGAAQAGPQAGMAQAMQLLQMVMQLVTMMQSQMGAMGGGAPGFGGAGGMSPGVDSFLGGGGGVAAAPSFGGGGGAMPMSAGGGAPMSAGGAGGPSTNMGPTMPGDPAAAVEIARSLMGRESRTLTTSDLPAFTRTGQNTNNCAEFVSSCLDKAGAYKKQPGDASVATLAANLQKQGWKKVSKEQAKPGDVAVYNKNQHVELVSQPGGQQLIGSNGDALQVVGTSKGSWGNIEYYSKG